MQEKNGFLKSYSWLFVQICFNKGLNIYQKLYKLYIIFNLIYLILLF